MDLEVYKKSDFYEDYISSQKEYYERENADAYFAERLAEKDKEIAELKKEISRQKRLRCYNLKMWCSAERFTNRSRTIPDEGRWWERHFYSVCRVWERLKEADK